MSLLALQQDFRRWLTSEAANVPRRLGVADVAGFEVYLNTYRAQLMACLADAFAATRAWLGDAAFEAAAADHIDRLPPNSWTLDAYALGFPETLDLRYPDDLEVGELAKLERELGRAFVGPDAEQVDQSSLESVDWDRAVLGFVPTFTVLPAFTNATAIWSAIMSEHRPPAASCLDRPAVVAVWRNGFVPAFRTVAADEAEALSIVTSGRTFGDLCAWLIERNGASEGATIAGSFLGQWLQDGMIASIRTGD